MSRSLNRVWLLLACFMASEVFALGLGEVRLESALNQPLRADIELISATPEELDNLTVQLASAETFARYNIDRPFYLTTITFRIIRSGRTDGNVVRVSSSEPITEPFLTFLVEAAWSRGRLLREYTVLLDPPTFAPPPSAAQRQVVEPPVRTTPADSGDIQRSPAQPAPVRPAPVRAPAPAATPAPAQTADATPVTFDDTPGGDYTVVRGDTLWGIASRMRPDNRLTINQTMLAIFEANPDAFSNNINALSAGSSLRIPSADEVFRINRGDALAEVQRQNTAWDGSGPVPEPTAEPPGLVLVPADEETPSADSNTVYDGLDADTVADTAPLSIEDVRIQEIEELIADQQNGLVVISDNELAALRRELAELRGEEPPPELFAGDEEIAVDGDELLVDEDAVFTDDVEAADAEELPAGDEVGPQPVSEEPAPTVADRPRPQEPSLVERIIGLLTGTWTLIGAALVIVAGLLVWFARRASGGADDDEDATGLWEALDADDLDNESAQSTERLRAMARDDDTSIVVVEQSSLTAGDTSMTSTMEVPAADAVPPVDDALASTDTNKALEDTFSSETAINLDQSDPIAEADFHMAYGLYDQAADLINGALAVESDRQDLMAKLCEIYFVWGNRDAFVDAAQRLQTSLSGSEDPEWDKIVIMGQQIAADHALFSDASAIGATKAVDLSFDGGTEETGALDMDLAADVDSAVGDVIDLGAETQSTPAASSDASAIDFVFDDDDETGGTAVTEQMPAADPFAAAFDTETNEMPTVESGLDDTAESPTIESPAVDNTAESPTIEQQLGTLDATTTGEIPSLGDDDATELASLDDSRAADATAEIDLDDLGLDLDAMQGSLNDDLADHGDDILSDLDDTSESVALNIDDLAATGRNEALSDVDATGKNEAISATGLHDVFDLDDALAATSEVAALDGGDSTAELPGAPVEDDDIGIDTSLLDATGQTQILPEDFAVETGTGTNVEKALSDSDETVLAASPAGDGLLSDDAETLLASLDDDEGTAAGDFDFAKTEALPKETFSDDMSDDATGELPALSPGSTDMDLDLDDLTAALQISAAGDTVNQVRDDATVEQPRPNVASAQDADFDEEATAAISPDDMSDDLHDARTMTEVGTKLDLARAYVDMGDPGGARSILEEVLEEGDESQRQQARQLLDSLPS